MAKITYADKTDRRLVQIPSENKVTAGDLNEIKQSVNAIYDGNLSVIENNLALLPKYESEVDAIADGLTQGDSWFDMTTKTYKRIWNFIQSYTAGTSQIDFINNGGDDWTIGFKITPTSLQLPVGETVVSYDYIVGFSSGGIQTGLYSGTGILIDTPLTTIGNGAGVYGLSATYNISDGSIFTISYLIKVDGAGNILGSIKNDGNTINSINGLQVNYTANITQIGVTETINVIAFDGSTITNIGTGATGTVTLPLGTILFGIYTTLDPVFWSDIDAGFLAAPEAFNASTSVIIS